MKRCLSVSSRFADLSISSYHFGLCLSYLVLWWSSSLSLSSPFYCLPWSTIDVSSPPKEIKAQQTLIVSEPESVPSDPSAASPPDPSLSEVSACDPSSLSAPVPSEVSEATVTMDQDTPAAPSQSQGNKNHNGGSVRLCLVTVVLWAKC